MQGKAAEGHLWRGLFAVSGVWTLACEQWEHEKPVS